jgi:hypothetical protein
MRVAICHLGPSGLTRLVWFTQSRAGVYLGYFGTSTDHHHSFHADGRRHLRTRTHKDLMPPSSDSRIDIHDAPRQLLNASISVLASPGRVAPYCPSGRREQVVLITDAQLGGSDRISFDYYLMRRDGEPAFLRMPLQPMHSAVLSVSQLLHFTLPLEHFPEHKVGFSVRVLLFASDVTARPDHDAAQQIAGADACEIECHAQTPACAPLSSTVIRTQGGNM